MLRSRGSCDVALEADVWDSGCILKAEQASPMKELTVGDPGKTGIVLNDWIDEVCTELEDSGGGRVERQDGQRPAADQAPGEGRARCFVRLFSVCVSLK